MNNRIDKLVEILVSDAKKIATSMDFKNLSKKKIIITGANGLIGINFLTSLLQISKNFSGIEIYAVIHSSPSEFLLPFLNNKEVTIFRGDLTDELFIESLPTVDIIIHAAGSGIPSQFLSNKLSSLKINTVTTIKLFEKLNKEGRFLFLSSSDLYNGLEASKYSEDQIGTTNTNHPRACYIEGKRTGETICNIFREMGIKAYAVRLSLTYGPGVSFEDSRVLPSFIRKALNGSIEMLDSGNVSRTFCYISDAIEMMWFVLLNGNDSLYNIGGIENIKVKDLGKLIGKLLKVPVIFPTTDLSILGAPQNVEININRFLQESKKESFVELQEGLVNTIDWFRYLSKND